MELTDALMLDHFLFSFRMPAFNRLNALYAVFKNCEHTVVKRPDTSYEGVYLIARDGNYLELLKNTENTPNIFALAISSLSPSEGDVDDLPKRYPRLNWTSTQFNDSENTPWYTYYGQAPVEEAVKQLVVFWAMLYQNLARHRPYQFSRTPPPKDEFSVQEFIATKFKVPSPCLKLVERHLQWIPGKHTIGKKRARLLIPNASHNEFELIMEFDENCIESTPVSVTMRLVDDTFLESQELKGLRLTREENIVVLDFL